MKLLKRLFREEEGATAVEYGIMVALIAVVIIAAVTIIGTELRSAFEYVGEQIGTVPELKLIHYICCQLQFFLWLAANKLNVG